MGSCKIQFIYPKIDIWNGSGELIPENISGSAWLYKESRQPAVDSWGDSPAQVSYPMASSEILNSSVHCDFIGINPKFQGFDWSVTQGRKDFLFSSCYINSFQGDVLTFLWIIRVT